MAQAPHEPTKKTRNLVKLCKVAGITDDLIAEALGITRKTMRKYYLEELTNAKTQFLASCVSVLAHHIKRNNLTAAIFALKTQGGWRERGEIINLDDIQQITPPQWQTPKPPTK